jgi:hypothetical protein
VCLCVCGDNAKFIGTLRSVNDKKVHNNCLPHSFFDLIKLLLMKHNNSSPSLGKIKWDTERERGRSIQMFLKSFWKNSDFCTPLGRMEVLWSMGMLIGTKKKEIILKFKWEIS